MNNDDDIDRWVDQLAGQKRPDAPADEAAEVQALQRAIEARALREAASAPLPEANEAADAHAWQQLQFRMRGEGLLKPKRPAWLGWPSYAAAALLVLAVGVGVYLRPVDEPEVVVAMASPPKFRGELVQIDVTAAEPLAQAKRLARALQKLSAQPQVYFFEQRATVDFELVPAQRSAIERELAALAIPTAGLKTGVTRVIFNPQ